MAQDPVELHPVTFFDKDESPKKGTKDWRPRITKVEDRPKGSAPEPDVAETANRAK